MQLACWLIVFVVLVLQSGVESRVRKRQYDEEKDTIVELPKLGSIQGKILETAWSKREVLQFVDVRYAEPPTGLHRFKAPRPIEPWEDVMDATAEKIGCPSVVSMDSLRQLDDVLDVEDCLTMTITTPNVTSRLPVLVYIHGEYLYEGSNSEAPPDYLLEKDIVLVTPQYRLGPFGFLSTKTDEIPGNAGVLDIFLALQFIKHFIKYFGGDPAKVTVAGQVGGAAIAHLLTLSPIVQRGLFKQVIYHSGSAIMPIFLEEDPRKHAQEIAKKADCQMVTVRDLNNCLMELTALELLTAFMEHALEKSDLGIGHTGGIQFTIGGPSGVLPKHPYDLMLESNFSYPAMGGCPKNAGTRVLNEIVDNDFEGKIPDDEYNTYNYIDHVLRQVVGTDKTMLLTSFVTHEFFNRELMENGTFATLIPRLIDVAGTLNHKLPVLLALNMNNKHNPHNTFLYTFDYAGEFNRYKEMDEETNMQSPFKAGVSLTDEALYLFPYPEHVTRLSPHDLTMAHRMVDLWTSFVIDGNPLGSHRIGLWPPMTTLYGPYLRIDETLTIGGNYFSEFSATLSDEEDGHSLIREIYYLRSRKRPQKKRRKHLATSNGSRSKKQGGRKSLVKRPNRNKIRF
ncbi:LOW QUALITY PROTEIN: glutactin [Drosophila eugracilis]|uniref:LOW QUALITY PROTEIN: glutactin n=1 Tax=Drosophila eugracilis TaxID=29029 RepID=UPI001BD9D0E4|nr:LOW QUALITY PROTEIN: glutactin [Drosophila eugracilis]